MFEWFVYTDRKTCKLVVYGSIGDNNDKWNDCGNANKDHSSLLFLFKQKTKNYMLKNSIVRDNKLLAVF